MMNKKLQSTIISFLLVLSALAIFIPSVEADEYTVIVRPNGAGNATNWNPVGAVNNWQCVDEVTPDNYTTHIWKVGGQVDDFYNVTNPSHIGTVTNVTVHVLVYAWEQAFKLGLYFYDEGWDTEWSNWIYADYHHGDWKEYNWTLYGEGQFNWTMVDTMQIGIKSDFQSANCSVTQMWATVYYTYVDDPPVIANVTAFPSEQRTTNFVNITCDVTDDNNNVSTVKLNVTYPDSSTTNNTMGGGSYYYNTTYTQLGTHSYFIWANDTTNHNSTSSVKTFEIIDTNTFYVDDDYSASTYGWGVYRFDKIQNAVDNASSGAVIYVNEGTYSENVYINTPLNITGNYQTTKPWVNGSHASKSTFEIMVDWGNISGLNIDNTAGLGNNYHCISIGKSGAQLEDHFNWTVKECNMVNCNNGILLRGGYFNVSNCDIDASTGIYSLGPSMNRNTYNKIYNNSIHDGSFGIDLYLSYNNTVWENNISKNTQDGVQIGLSHYNTIYENDFYDNGAFGIDIGASCNNNKIYHNNFIKNNEPSGKQGDDNVANTNYWDDGYTTSGGNYWNDFDEAGEGAYDNNSDGVVDSPYTFTGGQDNYPLISEDGWETMSVLNISLTPNSIDFGTVSCNSYNLTTDYYFNLTNYADTCDIKISVGNSQNLTFVNYSDIGHDMFTMNWSGNNWTSESNINVGGSTLKNSLAQDNWYLFDLKVIMPTSISKIGNGESVTITLTAIAI